MCFMTLIFFFLWESVILSVQGFDAWGCAARKHCIKVVLGCCWESCQHFITLQHLDVAVNTSPCIKACCGFTPKMLHPPWVHVRNAGLEQGISCKRSCASDLGAGIAKQIILVQELARGNRDKKQRCQGAGGLGLGGQGGDEKELSRRQLRGEMRIVAAGRAPGW